MAGEPRNGDRADARERYIREGLDGLEAVWIIVENGGYEGYRVPQMAFLTEEEATAALHILPLWHSSHEVHKVPLWTLAGRKALEE